MTVERSDTPSNDGTGSLEAAADVFARLIGPDEGEPRRERKRPAQRQEAEADEAEAQQAEDEGDASDDDADEADTDAEAEDDAEADADSDADAEQEPEDEADADDEGDDDASEDLDRLVTVKIDGKVEKIPLKEAIAGYQRQADYSRKTAEVAEARKQAEAELQAVRTERAQYGQILTALAAQLDHEAETQQPDWENLRQTDPAEYAAKRLEWQDKAERRRAIHEEQQRLGVQAQQEQAKAHNAMVADEREKLLTARPQWRDPQVWQRDRAVIREFGKTLGFSDQELDGATDHRAILAMEAAMKWHRLQAKKAAAKPATPKGPVPKPLTQGTSNKPPRQITQRTKAMQRLSRTGDIEDAAAVFATLL